MKGYRRTRVQHKVPSNVCPLPRLGQCDYIGDCIGSIKGETMTLDYKLCSCPFKGLVGLCRGTEGLGFGAYG